MVPGLGEMHPFTRSVLRSSPLSRFLSRMHDDASAAAASGPLTLSPEGKLERRPVERVSVQLLSAPSPQQQLQREQQQRREHVDREAEAVSGRVIFPLLPPIHDPESAALAEKLALQSEASASGGDRVQVPQQRAMGGGGGGEVGGGADAGGADTSAEAAAHAASVPGVISLSQLTSVVRAAILATEEKSSGSSSSRNRH